MKIDLDEILKEWEQDSVIDNTNLDEDSRNTPKLHAKYLRYISNAKLKLVDIEFEQKNLMKDKWLWISGKLSEEKIKRYDWKPDPFDGLKVLKSDHDKWFESDKDLQDSERKIQYYKSCIDTLKEIVDMLKWRHQTIKNMIEWRKFQAGG